MMEKFYCKVELKRFSQGPCLYERDGMDTIETCRDCIYFNEKIYLPKTKEGIEVKDKELDIKPKKRKPRKVEKERTKILVSPEELEDLYSKDFPSDENRYMYSAMAMLSKPLINYQENPGGFRNHPNLGEVQAFIEPFLEYCYDKMTLLEAHKKFWLTFNTMSLKFMLDLHKVDLETTFEIETGKNLEEVLPYLESNDKEIAQQAAIDIIKVCKDEKGKNPTIQKLIGDAIKEEDYNFLKRIKDAHEEVTIDKEKKLTWGGRKKRPELLLLIRRLGGEDFIRKHSLDNVMNICSKHGIEIDIEALKEFLHYYRYLRKEKPGRPLEKEIEQNNFISEEEANLLNRHKGEFKFYLWGKGGLERFMNHLENLKK